jgi:hypothetical protein
MRTLELETRAELVMLALANGVIGRGGRLSATTELGPEGRRW